MNLESTLSIPFNYVFEKPPGSHDRTDNNSMNIRQKVITIRERLAPWLAVEDRLLEIQNSSASLVVGLLFIADTLFGGNLYGRFPDTYRYMEWLPSWGWGMIYSAAGMLHLLAVTFGFRSIRKQVLWIKGGLWIFIAMCVLIGDAFAASGWIYLIFALFAFRGFLKIKILGPSMDHVRFA